jgi:hypothetical protein
MGSVVIPSSPTCLHDAGDFSLERQTAEADAAHVELAQKAAGTPTYTAAIALAKLVKLQLPLGFRKLTGSSHSGSISLSALRAEGHAKQP